MKFMLVYELVTLQICISYRGYTVQMKYGRNDKSGCMAKEKLWLFLGTVYKHLHGKNSERHETPVRIASF
jgi:hypothetical protein